MNCGYEGRYLVGTLNYMERIEYKHKVIYMTYISLKKLY